MTEQNLTPEQIKRIKRLTKGFHQFFKEWKDFYHGKPNKREVIKNG
jgi:hypothetical protein